jgi:hypothetical protein
MRLETGDFGLHTETLLAVILGAVLATLSGLAATQFEAHLRRREREHDAALLFGELLSTLKTLVDRASEFRGRGDPYGQITMRIVRAARRELDIYDRNREALYELRDATIRLRLHGLMVRIGLGLDAVFDPHDAILAAGMGEPDARIEELRTARDRGFEFLVESAAEIQTLLIALAKPARRSFDDRFD